MPPAVIMLRGISVDHTAASPQSKNDPFSSVPKGPNKAAPVTQGGLIVSTYGSDKTTRYLARPSS